MYVFTMMLYIVEKKTNITACGSSKIRFLQKKFYRIYYTFFIKFGSLFHLAICDMNIVLLLFQHLDYKIKNIMFVSFAIYYTLCNVARIVFAINPCNN